MEVRVCVCVCLKVRVGVKASESRPFFGCNEAVSFTLTHKERHTHAHYTATPCRPAVLSSLCLTTSAGEKIFNSGKISKTFFQLQSTPPKQATST